MEIDDKAMMATINAFREATSGTDWIDNDVEIAVKAYVAALPSATQQPDGCHAAFEKWALDHSIPIVMHKDAGDYYEKYDTQVSYNTFKAGWDSRPMRESGNRQGLLDSWKPIETAPKKTLILAFGKDDFGDFSQSVGEIDELGFRTTSAMRWEWESRLKKRDFSLNTTTDLT